MTQGAETRTTGAATADVGPQASFVENDVHLSLALRAARMVVWEWDPGTDSVTTTGNLADVCGVAHLPSAADGCTLVHPDDVARHGATVQRAVATTGRYSSEFRIIRPDDGRTVWLEERGEAVCDERGAFEKLVGVVMDVTERVEAEAERARLLDAAQTARAGAEAARHTYETLLDAAPDHLFLLDAACRFTYVNTAAAAVMRAAMDDRPRREILGRTGRELGFPPAFLAHFEANHARALAGETTVAETPFPTTRGVRLFEYILSPVRDAVGAVTAVVGATRDIHDRTQTEAENAYLLAEAEAVRGRLAALVEQMPAGVIIAEAPAGRIVFGNPQVEQITRYPMRYSDDITRYTADWTAFHPDGRPVQPDEWPLTRAVTRGETVTGEEYRYRHRDGTDGWVQLDAAPIRDSRDSRDSRNGVGKIVAAVAILTDITARKQSEAALRESEARLRDALSAGAMGAWSWDIATGAVAWSDTIAAIHGLPPGAFDGTYGGFFDRVHPDDREQVQGAIATALREGDSYFVTFRSRRSDGFFRHIEGRGRIRRGADGTATGIAGLVTDVTERWEAEAERERLLDAERVARAEAEAAVRARDTFLSIAAHELKTPVTALKGNAQLILRQQARDTLDPDRLARALRGIDRATDRLAALTDDLLDVSRIRTGQLPLAPEPTDLHALLQEATERAAEGRDGRHRFVLDLPAALPPVPLDPSRIEQVLTNVLGNAIKYAPDGGALTLTVRETDNGVAVRVQDEGIGLPDGAAEAIFAPFGRAANALAHNFPGMGLGLYICRNIVAQHGGWMWAESDGEGRGTAVTFWLPYGTVGDGKGATDA